jgi:EmrB/QacA subfamily drug resistance transporter
MASGTGPSSADTGRARSSAILPYIVGSTFFMEYLDTTIIATALPQMARSFGVEPNAVSVGMSAYMLTLAVFIPVSGWIADRLGTRTVFGGAIVIFTLASLTCGLSTSLFSFTVSRILQGLGGALMVPVGRMIVVRNTSNHQMMKAISTITWPGIIAPVIGPATGGFITTYASWHWIFFLNLPFGILALWAARVFIPNQKEDTRRPLDFAGFILSGAALIAILYGTELASHQDASIPRALGLIAAGVILGVATIYRSRRIAHPLLDLTPFQVPTFAITLTWGSAARIGIEAAPYLLPLLFQVGFGLSAFHAGLLLMASAAGNLGMKFFTTPIFRRFGFRPVAIVNTALGALLILGCGWLSPSSPVPLVVLMLFFYGASRSLQFQNLGTLVYADVSDAQKGPASTLNSVVQQMTIGMGIAFGALVLRISSFSHDAQAGHAPIAFEDFRYAFALASLLTLISILGFLRLPRDAGSGIGGGGRKA